MLGLCVGALSCTCSDAPSSGAPPLSAAPPSDAPVSRCAVLLANERGGLYPELADCPDLNAPDRVSGGVMVLVGADGVAYTKPLVTLETIDGVLHFTSAEGQRLAGLYVRLAQARAQLAQFGWPIADEAPLPVIYPFQPPDGDIPAEWRIDANFRRMALLAPDQAVSTEKEAALAPGMAARALATLYLLRRNPDKSERLENEADQRFARNARLVLMQTFGLYVGAIVAGDIHYMGGIAQPGALTPGRVSSIDRATLRTLVTIPTDHFNPAPVSMNLAACEWAARQSVRAEDRADIDREAIAGWLANERLALDLPDPIKVLDWLLITHSPGPRAAFCGCLRERIPDLEVQMGVCMPYRPEQP
jgi:hypothetical protein